MLIINVIKYGLEKRIECYKVEDVVHYEEKNFYENVPSKKIRFSLC